MPHLHCLGNDAVDLDDPRCQGKATNERFLARVFSEEEVRAIRSSANPELTVWLLWAGKEAAFKSVTKDIGRPPVFQHNLFQVSYPDGSLKGEARYGNHRISLTAKVSAPHIHVVSWRARPNEPTPRVLWEEETNQRVVERFGLEQGTESAETLKAHFSPREWDCIPHPTSAVTRLAARRSLAEALDVDEARLEIVCRSGVPGRRVPLVLLDGEPTNSDLSLSHHRTLLAWAFTAPRGGNETGL
jgi:phosphopantetheinyl transferase (holo-ACP synthase)